MAEAISKVQHKGKTVIVMDYSNCDKAELLKRVSTVKQWMSQQELGSLLTITDVTKQHFDSESLDAFKKLAAYNKPYAKHAAVVGIAGLLKVAYQAVMAFSGRKMPIFETREQALDWVVEQE